MANGAELTRMKNTAYRAALYSVALFLIGVLQVTFFSEIRFFRATPDLLLGAVTVIALHEDQRVCSICGIVSGFLYCALGTQGLPTYILFSFLIAYILPETAKRVFGRSYLSFLALALLSFSLKAVYNIAESALSSVGFNLIEAVIRIALPELLSSMLLCSMSYIIVMLPCTIINKRSKKRKDYIKK